jgi:hypothetical protein
LQTEADLLFLDPSKIKGADEVSSLREMIVKLQAKCNQTSSDLQDLTRETNEQKQEFLYLIRDHDSDLKFANAVIQQMMRDSDLAKIKQRSVWNEGRKEWVIPNFIISDKKSEIQFPTINAKQRVD